jgi:hypothetical protein
MKLINTTLYNYHYIMKIPSCNVHLITVISVSTSPDFSPSFSIFEYEFSIKKSKRKTK